MTISADTTPDAGNKGNALATVPDVPGIDPFVAAKLDDAAAPRGLRARLLDYSAHAAMIVGLIGFAWTVGDHVVHRSAASADTPVKVAQSNPPAPAADPMAELRERNRELAGSVHALQARLDALQASVGDQGKVAAQVRVLQAGLDTVKTNLGAVRGEQTAAVTRLDGKIDKLAQQPTSKMQGLVDRLGKLERSSVDAAPTASLPHATDRTTEAKLAEARTADARSVDTKPIDAKPVPRPIDLKAADKGADTRLASAEDPAKPQVLTAWVVRDVYQGVALIEGRRGTLEVVPGVSIPGAGIVKSIDRHGTGWTVTTTKGVVAYAAAAPARDYRRAHRGYYPGGGYRYDF